MLLLLGKEDPATVGEWNFVIVIIIFSFLCVGAVWQLASEGEKVRQVVMLCRWLVNQLQWTTTRWSRLAD